ncbi:uncharacterized protein LOC133785554 [Humulus lupulus]|uniref:uncharacterized protein LOC133785554 n=1 Tax=Humulus lupulus TaxID=3486 RepID=UPI002B400C1C|nr:uncharacterized protein LOC133785554 [Humulus lupulus]
MGARQAFLSEASVGEGPLRSRPGLDCTPPSSPQNSRVWRESTRASHPHTSPGQIPSQPLFNAQGQYIAQSSNSNDHNVKEVNAITTRSGKFFEDSSIIATTSSTPKAFLASARPNASSKVPFPQALRPVGKVLAYAQIIKDLFTTKRKHHVKKTAFLTEQARAVIEQKTPPKYKDLHCPTISYQIRTHELSQPLLDLGASVNLMPYSVYSQLDLGEMKKTSVLLQLVVRSIKKPRGIVEDVVAQIEKFYYLMDFLVLHTHSEVNMEYKIPIIFGRPFMAIAKALIKFRNGLMNISFGNMTLEVNSFHIGK